MAYLPSTPNATLIDAFKATPEISHHLHDFAQAVMRGPSQLTPAQREMIAARVSNANGCDFCRDSHAAAARNLGADAETLRGVIEDASPPVDEAMQAALAYADKLNRKQEPITQGDVDAVLAAGWNEETLQHIILVVGFFNLMNRWVDGLGIGSDPQVVEMAGCMLSGPGYQAISEMLDRNKAK